MSDTSTIAPVDPRAVKALAAALEWARLDRAAEDRAAELWGVERLVAKEPPPTPRDLVVARERAAKALHEACIAEGKAEHDFKEAARAMLDGSCADREQAAEAATPGDFLRVDGTWLVPPAKP